MKIGINALCAENRSGTGRYTTQLLLALAQVDQQNSYSICAASDSPLLRFLAPYPNFQVYPWNGRGSVNRLLFERYVMPHWIAAEKVDLFHGPAFVIPPKCPVPAVVTIHDLVFRLYPRTVPLQRRLYYNVAIPRSIRQSALILADSNSTAQDLKRHMSIAEEKIATVPLGVSTRFFAKPSEQDSEHIKNKHGLPDRFILTLGTMEPRKNLRGLIEAYGRLIELMPSAPDLVIAGRIGWKLRALKPYLSGKNGIGNRIHFIGFVEDADLPALYHRAAVFACVSLYEGFGLPVLEAMAAGIPVVASNVSSLPEVMGPSACLANPHDPEEIAQAFAGILSDPIQALAQAEKARLRARNYSWKFTAEKTLEAYQRILAR